MSIAGTEKDFANAPTTFRRERFDRQVLSRTASHIHVAPHPALQSLISHYSVTVPVQAPENAIYPPELAIVPDASGCIVGTWTGQRLSLVVWGPNTQVVSVPCDMQETPLRFFVEFLPGGLYALLGQPQHVFLDTMPALVEVDPRLDSAIRLLFDAAELNMEVLWRSLDTLWLKRMGLWPLGGCVEYLLATLRKQHGACRVAHLAAETRYSIRHLNRLSGERLGMNIKPLTRVYRINTACMLFPHSKSHTHLAHALGYYDQSHFIRDFKIVCGLPPSSYVHNSTGFYHEALKQWLN